MVGPEDNIKDRGYETTFYQDFSIAERFGTSAVRETFDRVMTEWKSNYKYLTELVVILNHKIWDLYKTNRELAKLYEILWHEASMYAETHLEGECLQYYYRFTD